MDAETLKVIAQVAGIGGIALAVLLMVFKEVIQKNYPSCPVRLVQLPQ